MSAPVIAKRLQQGIFEALATQNRAAGSGAGTGFTVMLPLVNGGTQTSGPITGVAGPPTGLSGFGGEVVLTTATFHVSRLGWFRLEAICSDYVTTGVAHAAAHDVYFQVNGVDNATAFGFIPVFSNGDAEIRPQTTTILLNVMLQTGSHTVKVIWNSQEGANDTCTNSNNPLYVYWLGA